MALNKSAVATEPTAPAASPEAGLDRKVENKPTAAPVRDAEYKRVHGQVRMHAIIAGYKVGSALAATLGTSPNSIRTELHKLALEVADKIESYSFLD